jgi:hypothetical protein
MLIFMLPRRRRGAIRQRETLLAILAGGAVEPLGERYGASELTRQRAASQDVAD